MTIDALTFDEILASLTAAFKSVLGDDINLDPSEPIGQLLFLLSNASYELAQSFLAARNACIINSAQNQDLDNLVGFLNVIRSLGVKTLVPNVSVTGTNGTVIPAGSQASDSIGAVFESTTEITIAGGIGVADFIAVDAGANVVNIGTLTTIVTPIVGWDTVTNPEIGITGSGPETDAELRSKFFRSAQPYSLGYPGAVKSLVMRIPDTVDVAIFENDRDIVGPNAQPPHSIWPIVAYPDVRRNEEIAQALYATLPPVLNYADGGLPATVQTADAQTLSQGTKTMTWNKALETLVEFEVEVKNEDDVTAKNVEEIKQNLVDFLRETATIGGTIFQSQALAAIVCGAGYPIESIKFDRTGGTPANVDLPAQYYEIFYTELTAITVTFI
jgi:uncharacterized phage protein gp47/JayE